MDTALPHKFPYILDRNLAKANCTGNRVCTSCDLVALGFSMQFSSEKNNLNTNGYLLQTHQSCITKFDNTKYSSAI